MYRRTVLAGLSCIVTGCLGSESETADETTTRSTRATTTTTATSPADTLTTDSTTTDATTTAQPYDLVPVASASMTESTVRDRLADHECSELTDLPAICPGDDARLDVSVSPTVGHLSDTTVAYTVENRADERFETNQYFWRLHKWDGSQWRRIAPLSVPAVSDGIRADGSHTHRITPVERKVARSQFAYFATSDITLGGLGPGIYGFTRRGYFESTPESKVDPAAVFGLAGDAPPVRPTDDVTSVERDGSTLVVHTDASSSSLGAKQFTVSFVDGRADAHLLSEQVQQLGPLLNTLPYAATDDIDAIRYEGYVGGVNVAESYLSLVAPNSMNTGYNDYKSTAFGFRDYVFEVSTGGP